MTEWRQLWLVFAGLLLLAMFGLCYMIGGRRGKWVRRFLGGLLFPTGCLWMAQQGGTFHWLMLGSLIAYPAVLCLGYGGETVGQKLRRRTVYGLGLGAAGLWLLIPAGHPLIGLAQVVLAILVSLGFGIRNPITASAEEGQIALLSTCLIPFALIR